MKNLIISQEQAIELYPTSTQEMKEIFETTFGKEVFFPDIRTRVKSWEDAKKIVKSKYYITDAAKLNTVDFGQSCNSNKSNVPSEKEAKSVLAYCQLLTICKALNEDYIFTKKSYIFSVDYYTDDNSLFVTTPTKDIYFNQIQLKSFELAQHLIDNFEDLLKDYFMIC